MSDIVGVRCGINYRLGGAHQVCQDFFNAVKLGTIFIAEDRSGWHSLDMPLRKMSWRAKYFGFPRGCKDHSGEMLLLERCPHCSGDLAPVVPSFVNQSDGEE